MRGYIIILFTLLIYSCSSDTEPAESADTNQTDTIITEEKSVSVEVIGLQHPPYPEKIIKKGGSLALAAGEPAKDAKYSFTEVTNNGINQLWLSRFISRNNEGEALWEVVDAVDLPAVKPGEEFMIANCTLQNGDAVAAIVQTSDKEQLTAITTAWKVDRENGKLIEATSENITCQNEGLRAP